MSVTERMIELFATTVQDLLKLATTGVQKRRRIRQLSRSDEQRSYRDFPRFLLRPFNVIVF